MAAGVPRRGVVTEFDAERGLGVVRGEDGRELPFHCTRLVDGSRQVEVGTAVVYEVVAGPARWEAGGIVKL